MANLTLTPDQTVFFEVGSVPINATIVFTWAPMAVLLLVSWLATRKLTSDATLTRWQNLLEVLLGGMRAQIREVTQQDPIRYMPFVGTLFLFVAVSNTLPIIPGYQAPTGSLSTTAALAICVFVAVPIYGISQQGVGNYLKVYLRPSPFMLPFNIIGEVSRTLALAVRLFGNVMSGTMIAAILLSIAAPIVPAVMQVVGLLTGLIQAYIFAMLAMVYIAAATQVEAGPQQPAPTAQEGAASHG
ncbi:F0F1 ATP synthase subunit A [bacterium]|nr:F0F1 ATP synthase subunit A [bacterium]